MIRPALWAAIVSASRVATTKVRDGAMPPCGKRRSVGTLTIRLSMNVRSRKPTSTEDRGNKMAWFFILFADVFEVAWPFLLKWSVSLSGWAPLFVAIIVAVPVNFLLAEAVKQLRDLYRNRNGRNSNHWGGIFWRKRKFWSRLLLSSDRCRADRSASLFRCRRISSR